MKYLWAAGAAVTLVFCGMAGAAGPVEGEAARLERSGEAAAARAELLAATQKAPNDAAALGAYAAFLDRYEDAETTAAYRKWLAALPSGSDQSRLVARRIALLDLVTGDRASLSADLAAYRTAGGSDLTLPAGAAESLNPKEQIEIPGPLRSFARMAAISSEPAPGEVLPALARNVVTNGYQASRSNESLEPTEFLKLLVRYISQARELDALAGPKKVIEIETCESARTADLLRIIGFRMRGGCGSEVVLETVNASRAFLTTDSGFPLADLEQALRTNRPFKLDYQPTRVPVTFGPNYWVTAKEKGTGDFLDAFLADPSLCRFYLGMTKLDRTTALELRKGVPMQRLRAYAHVLDFFGGMFEIRGGRAVVPGGQRSAVAWGELAGASPEKGAQFFERILAKDDGWLASLYDATARMHGPVLAYLTDPVRMKRFYAAVRGSVTSPGPARPVFRANADMMLLTTRLRLDPDGRPHIPGGVAAWRDIFSERAHIKYDAKLTRSSNGWQNPDDVVEALFALSHKSVDNEPLKIFMSLSDMDRYRTTPLTMATVELLASEYHEYGAQYRIFSDVPTVSDATIARVLSVMQAVSKIRDPQLRGDSAGSLQGLIGLWQIVCRQGSLPAAAADQSLANLTGPFGSIHSDRDLFAAARSGVNVLLAGTGPSDAAPSDRMLMLLAGAGGEASPPRDELIGAMQRVLDAQRVLSLTSLMQAGADLDDLAAGKTGGVARLQKLSARISEIQLPRPPLSGAEKSAMAIGYWTEKHIDNQRKLVLRAQIDKAGHDAERVKAIEGSLAPLLRDTLVALNYAHDAPPGAQILYTNPLFVRSHDFLGPNGNAAWRTTEMQEAGWPSNGGGRLLGSLVNLPYTLAEAEQNFLVPTQTQALIWDDLAPQILLSARVPRWWRVTGLQMHWVNLHMELAQTLMAEAAFSPEVRSAVLEALRTQASPSRVEDTRQLLEAASVSSAIERVTPVELYVIASALESSPSVKENAAAMEIREIEAQHPAEVTEAAISEAFGTPKPTLSNSYRPELLKLRTFPTLMGYSSRMMAESWESNTLYWAALGDQMHVTPGQLNVLIPEWTEQVVERIFASHLEDWPALLRSLRTVGAAVRSGTLTEQGVSEQGGVAGQPAGS